MGQLVNGVWHSDEEVAAASGGKFVRRDSVIRNWITADGTPGPSGRGGFRAMPGRYHLYVAWGCPWAHRTLIFRSLKGLTEMIGLSIVHYDLGEQGWTFAPDPDVVPDPVYNAGFLHEVYSAADPGYSGRVTVPVLFDTHTKTLVSNESSEIIEMFNSAFDGVGAAAGDYFPADLRDEIDAINARIYDTLNNGVYKCGFARSQAAYDAAIGPLFETLDWMENRLSENRYLLGDRLTAADLRAFPTLFRFDAIYAIHFKCSRRRLVDYPNLWAYTRDLYQHPGIAETVNLENARKHYYGSMKGVNPTGIVAALPDWLDLDAPHGREALGRSRLPAG